MTTRSNSYTVWIGLGSNLGDRVRYLRAAVEDLRRLGTVTAVSSLWETAPVGLTDQPAFLNAVAALTTAAPPQDLLPELLKIERRHGRDRMLQPPKGPRTLDLDLLLAGTDSGPCLIDSAELTLPHPSLQDRRFVLAPLHEIAPNLEHPTLHKTIQQILRDLPQEGPNHPHSVRRVGSEIGSWLEGLTPARL
jgi:2-amino-4-hydroxy-6-hydroxymethyldihydropteridine diphosphokinase